MQPDAVPNPQATPLAVPEKAAVRPLFTPELCALEIARANDNSTLQVPNERLTRIGSALARNSILLLEKKEFQGVMLLFAWDSVNAQEQVRSSPLTADLVPRVFGEPKQDQQKAGQKFMKETSDGLIKTVRERISALQERIEAGSIADLTHADRGSLLQLSECVFKFILSRSLPRQMDEIRPAKPTEFVLPSTAEYSRALARALPAGTEALRTEALAMFLAHRLVLLEHARELDDAALVAPGIQRKLQAVDQSVDAAFLKKVLDAAVVLRAKPALPPFKTFLDSDLPAAVVTAEALGALDTVAELAYHAETSAVRAWLNEKSRGVDAYLIQETLDCHYVTASSPFDLRPAVKMGLVSKPRAWELKRAVQQDALAPGDTLHVHLMSGRAPRVFEAAYLTGAKTVTVYGDFAAASSAPEGELLHVMEKAYTLNKIEPSPVKARSLVAGIGSGQAIVENELRGIKDGCSGVFVQAAVPEAVHAMERRCCGSAAWTEDSYRKLKSILIFDGRRTPDDTWESKTLVNGVVRAVPLNRLQPEVLPKPEIQTALVPPRAPTPVVEAPPAPVVVEAPPAPAKQQPAPVAVEAPPPVSPKKQPAPPPEPPRQPQAAPSHVLPPKLVEDLAAWIKSADQIRFFASTLKEEEPVLRKAARGSALSAKEHRMVLRLGEILSNRRHLPSFSNIAIPEARERLAELLLAAKSEMQDKSE